MKQAPLRYKNTKGTFVKSMTMKKMSRKLLYLIIPTVLVLGLAFTGPFNNRFFEIAKNIEIFSNVYKEINTNYVDDLDPSKMMKIGIDAMLDALDPYTKYISEAEVENYRLATEGKYEGVGARIVSFGDELVVTDIYKGSPAEKAGMKIADRILEVNGQSAEGRNGRQAMKFMRGAPGTEVTMKIRRPGQQGVKDLTLQRAEIARPSVPYSGLVSDDVAYVSLQGFTPGSGNDLYQAFKKLDDNHEINSFILDLRGNGGGLLSEAVNICNLFIPKDNLVVSTKAKVKDRNKSYKTRAEAFDTIRPLVILIDKNSASASEIVSGTIQDYDRGVIMGQLSFGKGLVQNTKDVGYNSRVKITTSKYYIPSGRCIQAVEYEDGEPVRLPDSLRAKFKTRNGRIVLDGGGIKPDIELEDLEDNELLRFLDKKGLIFNYVTDYIGEKNMDSIPANYDFESFDDFVVFFNNNRGDYVSGMERMIGKLKDRLSEKGNEMDLKMEIASLEEKLDLFEQQELMDQRETIERLIEVEVVKRFELSEGREAWNIQEDPEVAAAVQLLDDSVAYEQVLVKK